LTIYRALDLECEEEHAEPEHWIIDASDERSNIMLEA